MVYDLFGRLLSMMKMMSTINLHQFRRDQTNQNCVLERASFCFVTNQSMVYKFKPTNDSSLCFRIKKICKFSIIECNGIDVMFFCFVPSFTNQKYTNDKFQSKKLHAP